MVSNINVVVNSEHYDTMLEYKLSFSDTAKKSNENDNHQKLLSLSCLSKSGILILLPVLKVKIIVFSPIDSFVLKRLEFCELGDRNPSCYGNCSRGSGLAIGYAVCVGSAENVSAPPGSQHQLTVSNISRRL